MLAIIKNTASAGVLHESIPITGVSEEFLDTVYGPNVGFDSMLRTPT